MTQLQSLQMFSGSEPQEGRRYVPLTLDFTAGGSATIQVDMNQTAMSQLCGVFIDNSLGGSQVSITFQETGETISCGALSQSWTPISVGNRNQVLTAYSNNGLLTPIKLLNFAPTPREKFTYNPFNTSKFITPAILTTPLVANTITKVALPNLLRYGFTAIGTPGAAGNCSFFWGRADGVTAPATAFGAMQLFVSAPNVSTFQYFQTTENPVPTTSIWASSTVGMNLSVSDFSR